MKFMAAKTIEASSLNAEDGARMLDHRSRQIEQASTMLRERKCFRQSGKAYFDDTATANRKTFSEWLIHWVFGETPAKVHHDACCDFCDAKLIAKGGRLAYAAWVLRKI